jgi:hypothetical protein
VVGLHQGLLADLPQQQQQQQVVLMLVLRSGSLALLSTIPWRSCRGSCAEVSKRRSDQ